jgi:hypothetical protein
VGFGVGEYGAQAWVFPVRISQHPDMVDTHQALSQGGTHDGEHGQ